MLAAERHQLFELGWFLDPILGESGDYPAVMRDRVPADRLPTFTPEQRAMVKGEKPTYTEENVLLDSSHIFLFRISL